MEEILKISIKFFASLLVICEIWGKIEGVFCADAVSVHLVSHTDAPDFVSFGADRCIHSFSK